MHQKQNIKGKKNTSALALISHKIRYGLLYAFSYKTYTLLKKTHSCHYLKNIQFHVLLPLVTLLKFVPLKLKTANDSYASFIVRDPYYLPNTQGQ